MSGPRIPHLCSISLILLLSGFCLRAQEVRATITGMIQDPSGAPVPSATVTITSTVRNTSITTESNESGNYVTPFLAPGSYTLQVERTGFKKFMRESIVLEAMSRTRVDVILELGQLADSVTVKESVSVLETESASRSQLIAEQLVKDVPTQGRNLFQVAWSAAGVVKGGDWRYLRAWDIGGTSGFSVNGGKNKENEVLLDGISNVQADRTIIHVPTIETVQEFKVLTNTYDAQYGRTGGGIVSIVTKGGGNDFHGSAFEYWQGSKLNANTAELNRAGVKKPPMTLNTFGMNANGPVYIPKVFDGRNRLFWMLSYEGVRQRNADPGVYSVPEMDWRAGDFSSLRNAQGQQVNIFDPLATDTATGKRLPFAGNKIPSNRINPVATKALAYYPAPTGTGDNAAHVNNYVFPSRWIADMNAWIGRLDLMVNDRNNVYFRYGQNPYQEYRSLVFVMDMAHKNPAEPSGNSPLMRNGRNFTFDWTSTISPRMTFDLRAGLNRWEYVGGSTMGADYDPRQLGFDPNLVAQFTRYQFPQFNLGSYQRMGSSVLNFGTDDTYSIQPSVNFMTGRHFMKFGTEIRQYKDNKVDPGYASGNYTFDKTWTRYDVFRADTTSGNEIASFLLGYPASGYVDRNISPTWLHRYYALFFNDDVKLTSRLTINLGVRWDYESPNYERYDRMVRGLDLMAASPLAHEVSGIDVRGPVLFAGLDGQPRYSFAPDRNNVQPRVGVAYRIGKKWVLRGGYGLYYLGQNETGSTQGFSRATSVTSTLDGYTPVVTIDSPFKNYPNGHLLSAIGSGDGAGSFLGEGVQANWLDRPLPYSHQYSIDIQRELPGNTLLEVGYVGNITKKVPVNVENANFVPVEKLGMRTADGKINTAWYTEKIPNAFQGLIPNNPSLNGATIQRQILMYAYPQFSSVKAYNLPIGGNRYHGFQSKFSKRYSHGFTAIASYSIMKNLETMSMLNSQFLSLTNPSDTKLEKRSAGEIDIPQKFVISGVWELPFGRGRAFANHISKAAEQFIGGWQLNFDVSYASGTVLDYPNAAQVQAGSAKLDKPTMGQWFNTAMWQGAKSLEPYTLRDFPSRFGDIRGPGAQNWDASVSKYFPIKESVRMQFRFEALNALNHPWFARAANGGLDFTNANFGRLDSTQRNLPRWLKLGAYIYW